jgi:uncharacterized protein (TIGR02466 family)
LSAVFYCLAPEGSGSITFKDEDEATLLAEKRRSYEESFSKGWVSGFSVDPEEGLLLVFPSFLSHEVLTGTNSTPRVSLAMNYTIA